MTEKVINDPLNDALHEATLAVLLGSTQAPYVTTGYDGQSTIGITTLPSAFTLRMQERARKGDFDSLINRAVEKLTADHLVELLAAALVQQMIVGLEPVRSNYNNTSSPGWLSVKAREIAVEAATKALMADEGMLDTLRARIGMEVDRNRVGISVQLSDPEVGK